MELAFDALAHYTRGLVTMFFIAWTMVMYRLRKRDRMTYVLFITVAYLSLCYSKDVVFLVTPWMENVFVQNLVMLIDISCTPFVCAFFYEATRPGSITNRRLVYTYIFFLATIPLYCILQSGWVVVFAFAMSMIESTLAVVLVFVNSIRYDKCLSDNYSYRQDISVGWVVWSSFCYFIWFAVYIFCFFEPTWFDEVIFDLSSIIIWTVLCLLTHKHKVIVEMLRTDNLLQGKDVVAENIEEKQTGGECVADEPEISVKQAGMECDDDFWVKKDALIAEELHKKMVIDKMYLNPHLSLSELALAVGSNRSYLSGHINRSGKSFYDFVNEFRIAEACRILDDPSIDKIPMADVAKRSGFNSISSFNRYFFKIKGITPTDYIRK